MLTDWFSDHSFRRLLRNAGWLLSGNVVGGGLGLAAILVAARYLGSAQFGIIALITTYVALVDRLLNFQTWQALIRHGAKAIEAKNATALRRLVKVCTLLDLGSALTGAAIAAIGAGMVARLFDLDIEAGRWMTVYSLVIAVNLAGVPTAILRLFDRFRLLAAHNIVQGSVSIVGVALAWALDGGIAGVLLALATAQIFARLFLLICGWQVLAREGVRNVWRTPFHGLRRDSPGLLSFVIWTNVESSVKILREIDVFVVKALLSIDAVGLYFAARKIANVMETAIAPFVYAIYPELSRYVATSDRRAFLNLFRRSSVTVGAAATVMWFILALSGKDLIEASLGESYRAAYAVMTLCTLGTVIWAWGQPLSPAMFSLGLVDRAFLVHLSVAILYLSSLVPLTAHLGLVGAGVAYGMFHAVWCVLAGLTVLHGLGRGEKVSAFH